MIENWFATPIYFSQIENEELASIQLEIEKTLDAVEHTTTSTWSERLSTTFDNQTNDIYLYQLTSLEKTIKYHTIEYAKQCGYEGYMPVISNSWFNFNRKNDFQFPHSHDSNEAVLSGTYYFLTNQQDGDIVFENPNPMMESKKFPSRYSFDTVSYKPEIGKLLLFPSWLRHRVQPNQTENTRISISFNIEWSKLFE